MEDLDSKTKSTNSNPKRQVVFEEWWISDCLLYDYEYWARLSVFDDGSARIIYAEDEPDTFVTRKDAEIFLLEDEFTRFERLDEEDEYEYGISLASMKIPSGETEAELIESMRQIHNTTKAEYKRRNSLDDASID